MKDSDLLVLCHCKIHDQLYYVIDDNITRELTNEVTYIDPSCPKTTWDDIESNSKKYIWGFNCPIRMIIAYSTKEKLFRMFFVEDFIEICKESWRTLKPGGKLIFSGDYDKDFDTQPLQEYINNHDDIYKWHFSVEKASEFEFNLAKKHKNSRLSTQIHTGLAVFTKPNYHNGGKHKNTRRKSRKRRKN